jgi:Flp pilus assembly protein TadG
MRTKQRLLDEKGAALLETALTLPLVLLIAVGIFEFGRAYQTWQVLTNAAREAARVAVLPGAAEDAAETRAKNYMTAGQLPHADDATVDVEAETLDLGGGLTAGASRITVSYPFDFIVLQPIARLVNSGSSLGGAMTMTASVVMRNE